MGEKYYFEINQAYWHSPRPWYNAFVPYPYTLEQESRRF